MTKASKYRIALIVAVATALMWLALRPWHAPVNPQVPAEDVFAGSKPRPCAAPATLEQRASIAQRVEAGARGPVIDGITLEKPEVCYGEENFALVRAHADKGGSDRLIVRLAGTREFGMRLPFRVERGEEAGDRQVLVFGPGGPGVAASIPAPKMKPCDVTDRVEIETQLAPRSTRVLELTARLSAASGFEPASYEWDFGDGSTQTTESPVIEHSFEGAPQRTRFANFLMHVKAKDRQGRTIEGSRAYGFPNWGFGALVEDNRVALFVGGSSDPGEVQNGGERVRLYHGFDRTVHLSQITIVDVAHTPDGEHRTEGATLDPQRVLGVDSLEPGHSTLTADLSALRPGEPNKVRLLELHGEVDGLPASGRIVLTSTAPVAEPGDDPRTAQL